MSRQGWRDKKRESVAAPRRAMAELVPSVGTTRSKRLRRSLRVTLGTGLVVLAVVAALAIPDVWQRVGAALLSRTETTGTVVLDESFDGDTLNTSIWNTCHWWADHGCTIASNDELEWYLPEQVSVSDGTLRLTADRGRTRGSDGKDYEYRSGMVTTGPTSSDSEAKVSWTYGTVEARLRVPAGRGLWPALWMLPASGESRPEIDIMEVIGQDPGQSIMHFHPSDRSEESPSKRYRLPGESLAEGWHTLRLDWLPERLTFFVDGEEVWRVTGDQVPDEPMYLVINLAVGGVYPGPPDETTRFPATFEIDRVRITTAA